MEMIRYIFIFNILFNVLYSENIKDYDMDGVPDNIDRCIYTPFFNKVDKFGCTTTRLTLPEDKDNHSLDIIFNYGLSHNDDSMDRENLFKSRLELNYYRNSWIYELKTAYLNGKSFSDIDDTILDIKRHFQPKQNIKLTVGGGVKIPIDSFKKDKVDYIFLGNINYYMNDTILLFLGSTYTFVNDKSSKEKINNQYSYYLGGGYFITKKLYGSLSYSINRSKFKTQHLISIIDTTLFYEINKKWFTSLHYSNELLDDDLHNSFNCTIGYSF